MVRSVFGSVLGLLLSSQTVFAQVVFDIEFDASASVLTNEERSQIETHLREAGRRWLQVMDHVPSATITILVDVDQDSRAGASSTIGVPIGVLGGRDLLEQGTAYELRTGIDPNTDAEPDAHLRVGLNYLRNHV